MCSLYPSLLAVEPSKVQEVIYLLNRYGAGFHIDVMDGRFVPNMSWHVPEVNTMATLITKKTWVHLMVENPLDFLSEMELESGSIVSFHIETKHDKKEILDFILEKNWLPSLAISPKTDIQEIFPWLDSIYQVLVMSVNPGFAGQPFLKETIHRLDPLIAYRDTANLNFRIGIDGGIDPISIGLLARRPIDDFVIGSALFKGSNAIEALEMMRDLIEG